MGRRPGIDKPKGRTSAYAFFVQTCRNEHRKNYPNEVVVFGEFAKKCAERWKTMSDKEKKRFQEMADQDKARYDGEMESYQPLPGEKRPRKQRQKKDPNAPKRGMSGFFWFCQDERKKVMAEFPDYRVGDVAKELSKRWAVVIPDVKAQYEAMAAKDRKRYETEMAAYRARGGGASGSAAAKKPKFAAAASAAAAAYEDDDDEEDEESDE